MGNQGSNCKFFHLGKPIADELKTGVKDLSTYIDCYNKWAEKHSAPLIEDEKYLSAKTDEEKTQIIKEYAGYVYNYMHKTMPEESRPKERIINLGKTITAQQEVAEHFTPDQLVSFRTELVELLRRYGSQVGYKEVGKFLENYEFKQILSCIRNDYIGTRDLTALDIDDFITEHGNPFDGTYTPEEEIEFNKLLERLQNICMVIGKDNLYLDNDFILDKIDAPEHGYFDSLCIVNLSEFKRLFGKAFNPESGSLFNIDNTEDMMSEEEEVFDVEESVKDRWMEIMDSIDPSGSLSHIVYDIISRTPLMKLVVTYDEKTNEYNEKYEIVEYSKCLSIDGHGIPVKCDPRVEARKLIRLLSTCTSRAAMMEKLSANKKYEELVSILRDDVRLQTTFFESFNRYYLNYYYTKDSNGKIAEIHLNNTGKAAKVSSFIYRLNSATHKHSRESIFWRKQSHQVGLNYVELGNLEAYYDRKIGDNGEKFYAFDEANQKVAIEVILSFLDIDVTPDTANDILNDPIRTASFLSNTKLLINKLREKAGRRANREDNSVPAIEILRGYFAKPNDNESNVMFDALSNILDMAEATEDFNNGLTGMISYKSTEGTKTLATNIQMSHLTTFIKECNSCTPEEVRNMIQDIYSADECFYDSDKKKYRVKWLEDLYNTAGLNSAGSFRKLFSLSRNLGFNETSFENIPDKNHVLSMLSMYFNGLGTHSKIEFIDDEGFDNTNNLAESLKSAIAKQGKELSADTYYYVKGKTDAYIFNKDMSRVNKVNRNQTCVVPSFITGDTLALRGVKSLHYSKDEILDSMVDFFDMDIANSKKAKFFNDKGLPVSGNDKESFTKNGDKFSFLNFLNPKAVAHIKTDKGWQSIEGYWNQRLEEIEIADKDALKELFKDYLDSEADYFYEVRCDELGITDRIEAITRQGIYDDARANIRDYYYNSKFSLYNQMAITTASPAFYINAKEAQKRNKGNLTNGQQLVRDAIDPKTGKPVWKDPTNPKQRVIYVYDVKPLLSERDRNMLEAIFGKNNPYIDETYSQNTLTDGQGWRSFSSWRKIGLSFGKDVWTDQMEDAYWKIDAIQKRIFELEDKLDKLTLKSGNLEQLQANEAERGLIQDEIDGRIQEIEDLAVVFQPRKPICDGLEEYQGSVVPFQHKYAEIPIIPCLYAKGSAMRELGMFLEDNSIDMICSSKCGKKGVFGECDLQFKTNDAGQYIDSEGNVLEGVDAFGKTVKNPTRGEQRRKYGKKIGKYAVEVEGNMAEVLKKQFGHTDKENPARNDDGDRIYKPVIHECPLKNYLIQSNVPDHVAAPSLFGTQIRKIILGGINSSKTYNYKIGGKNVKISGQALAELYNALICANYFNSYGEFERMMKDPSRLAKELAKNIITNDRTDLATIDKIAYGIPLWEPSMQHDVMATLISMFKNTVIKQRINGGNIVQASALGSDLSIKYLNDDLHFETDASGIPTKCEAIIPFNFSYKNEFGETIKLRFEDYCNADGTFKTNKDGSTKIEAEFPGILDIVAYRIPTEAEYSAFHLKVKRCCPTSGANYIQLPTITTTRAGFDFDIDKLYLIRKTFDADSTDYRLKPLWTKIFNANPRIQETLQTVKDSITEIELTAVKEKYYISQGLEVPDNIPLNRFWEIAENRGYLSDVNKNELFKKFAKAHPELIRKNDFNSLNAIKDDGTIDLSKIFARETTKAELDNLLVDIILERLSDRELAKDSFTAGGFEDTSNDAKFIRIVKKEDGSKAKTVNGVKTLDVSHLLDRKAIAEMEDPEEDYDFSDPMTQVIFNKLNQKAAKLIGIYANDSSNYNIFANIKRMELTGKPIIFGSMINSNIPNAGRNMLVKESLGKTTKQRIAELLAASVDAVKDPVLNYLNLDTVTGEAATVLIRMGYDIRDIGILFNQPIISETLTLMSREGISSVKAALNIILSKHGIKESIVKLVNQPIDTNYLTTGALAYNLTEDALVENADYQASQVEVAKLFFNIMQVKDEFSNIVQQTRNTSANVVKSTLGEYLSRQDRINKYNSNKDRLIDIEINDDPECGKIAIENNDKPIKTAEDRKSYFEKYASHPFSFEIIVYNLITKAFESILGKDTPFRGDLFSNIFTIASTWCNYSTPSSDTYNSIMSETTNIIISKMYGDFNADYVNPNTDVNPNGLKNYELYIMHFEDFFNRCNDNEKAEIANSFFADSRFVHEKRINIHTGSEDQEYIQYVLRPNFNLVKEQKQYVSSSWSKLANSESENVRQFAKAFFLHMYYNHGLNTTSEFDYSRVPASVLELCNVDTLHDLDYIEFLDELTEESKQDRLDYTDNEVTDLIKDTGLTAESIFVAWILQHTDNKQYVYNVPKSLSNKFVVDEDSLVIRAEDNYLITHVKDNIRYATPFIQKDGKLYTLKGFNEGKGDLRIANKNSPLIYVPVGQEIMASTAAYINNDNCYLFGQARLKTDSIFRDDDYSLEDEEKNVDNRSQSFEKIKESVVNDKNLCQ